MRKNARKSDVTAQWPDYEDPPTTNQRCRCCGEILWSDGSDDLEEKICGDCEYMHLYIAFDS